MDEEQEPGTNWFRTLLPSGRQVVVTGLFNNGNVTSRRFCLKWDTVFDELQDRKVVFLTGNQSTQPLLALDLDEDGLPHLSQFGILAVINRSTGNHAVYGDTIRECAGGQDFVTVVLRATANDRLVMPEFESPELPNVDNLSTPPTPPPRKWRFE